MVKPQVPHRFPIWEDRNSGFSLMRQAATFPSYERTGDQGEHWWYCLNGRAVAYAKTTFVGDEEAPFRLQEVEVHPAFQGQGLLRPFLKRVEACRGETLWSTGNWTELGARSLHFLPIAPGFTPGVYYRPQTFVVDWENFRPRYH